MILNRIIEQIDILMETAIKDVAKEYIEKAIMEQKKNIDQVKKEIQYIRFQQDEINTRLDDLEAKSASINLKNITKSLVTPVKIIKKRNGEIIEVTKRKRGEISKAALTILKHSPKALSTPEIIDKVCDFLNISTNNQEEKRRIGVSVRTFLYQSTKILKKGRGLFEPAEN